MQGADSVRTAAAGTVGAVAGGQFAVISEEKLWADRMGVKLATILGKLLSPLEQAQILDLPEPQYNSTRTELQSCVIVPCNVHTVPVQELVPKVWDFLNLLLQISHP